jgi:3-deoxy-D-manno-octulosonate 8-phosphate phosphatase (KDO 8-P phosphatase)
MTIEFPPLSSIHTVALDFDGVFTNNQVWINQEGREMVVCSRADGLALDLVRAYKAMGKLRAEFFVLSKETNPVVLARTKKLGIDCHHGVRDKLSFLRQHLASRLPDVADPFLGLVYLGNDLNDLPIMRRAGFSVAPADAHPKILEIAHAVMATCGGDGFVRSFVEQLLGINQLSSEEIDELISNC